MASLTRRSLFGGIAALIAAPAIVRVASIMPVYAPRRIMTMAELMSLPEMRAWMETYCRAMEKMLMYGTVEFKPLPLAIGELNQRGEEKALMLRYSIKAESYSTVRFF